MATATVVAMAMVATVVDTVDTAEATMARGMLMPLLRLLLMPSLAMDTAAMADLMVAMEVMVMEDPMVDMAMESKPSLTKPFSSNQLSCFN